MLEGITTMRGGLRAALALAGGGAACLIFTTLVAAGDRGIDQVGDGVRPGLDIVGVTTSFSETALTLDVELAGDWIVGDGQLVVMFGPDPGWCYGYLVEYEVVLDESGNATVTAHRSSGIEASLTAVRSSVVGRRVTLVIPLDWLGKPDAVNFLVAVDESTEEAVAPGAGADWYPDQPSLPDAVCHSVVVAPDAPTPSPSSAVAPASAGSDSGPWLTVLPVTLLVAVAGLLAYDWLVAYPRSRRTATE